MSENTRDNRIYLKKGVTTGSCAAAAAKAAAGLLLFGDAPPCVTITLPAGGMLTLNIERSAWRGATAFCAVRKDAGDDPDVTSGVLVCAEVSKIPQGIMIDGGEGVGRVTLLGLDRPIGDAAINTVPRRMIEAEVAFVAARAGYTGGVSIVISIPGGEEIAKRTFNPRLGIVGGLSVIGTRGTVEPMSLSALMDSIRLQLRQRAAMGDTDILITPGSMGERFSREALGIMAKSHVNSSNFIGDTIEEAARLGFRNILLIGHIGKLVKLGIGITNTHSRCGDGRLETLIACALSAGADAALLRRMSECISTDAALLVLHDARLLSDAMVELSKRIQRTLLGLVPADTAIGFLCFTNAPGLPGVLSKSENAHSLIDKRRN